jgi:hypothetical protein
VRKGTPNEMLGAQSTGTDSAREAVTLASRLSWAQGSPELTDTRSTHIPFGATRQILGGDASALGWRHLHGQLCSPTFQVAAA